MILLLGATGKVGRLLRAAWPGAVGARARLEPVGRSGADLHLWAPGAPTDRLPRPDAIAALWGVTPGPGRDLDENLRLALAAQALGDALGARMVLHASSAAVYRPGPVPLREDPAPDPQTAYGAAKAAMEAALAEARGPRAVALRIGNVAGADSLFAALSDDTPLTLDRFADGAGPARSYIAPSDLARVLAALAMAEPGTLPPALNVAAPEATGMDDIARAAGRPITWRPAPPGAAARVALETGRLARICRLGPAAAEPDHLVADWRRCAEAAPA
ncbi:NAD-dependent epimerase/dehydratase family protein [Roseivivax sediminis]|uniref:NAD dependent epimerase/dehydratase family protein n=1 Tax=Roseivivax sediminis TaxID=936889 RepID=A0A1I1U7Y2_9RHOB|nr:NAD-dependent epimerase/dehydratase family protein [Roseivivax sediminis]SFD66804.1 NAD dependent epimerase/dehydratase family protein [Roseivivax sediminis]